MVCGSKSQPPPVSEYINDLILARSVQVLAMTSFINEQAELIQKHHDPHGLKDLLSGPCRKMCSFLI